ncbi:MAG: ABC transporter substrate-binding protein [Oscillospiraceae bacterium]|nr:ABC transporter substrate-binding protein [Oscillospiraceae bacterium]
MTLLKNSRFIIILLILSVIILALITLNIEPANDNGINDNENNDNNEPVILTWVTAWPVPDANKDFNTSSINMLLEEMDINIRVEFVEIEWLDLYQDLSIYLSNGGKADIISGLISLSRGRPHGVTNAHKFAYQNEWITPFESFIDSEDGKTIYETFNDAYWDALRINGQINGILTLGSGITEAGAILTKKDIINEENLPMGLDADLMKWKPLISNLRNQGFSYPIVFNMSLPQVTSFLGYMPIDGGVAIDPLRGAINLFEDEVFINFINQARSLVIDGYAPPTIDEHWKYWDKSPISVSGFAIPGIFEYIDYYKEYNIFYTTEPQVMSNNTALFISSASKYPNEAIKLLSLALTDVNVADAIVYGTEGVHYERIDGRVVPLNQYDSSWYLGLHYFCSPAFDEAINKREIFMNHINSATTGPLTGFTFDSRGWEDTILEFNIIIDNLIRRVTQAIENPFTGETSYNYEETGILLGMIADWEPRINKAIIDLKSSGMDNFLAEVNRQFDEWKRLHQR